MSKEISEIKDTGRKGVDLSITPFVGPTGKGLMLQLTQGFGTQIDNDEPGFIQLTQKDSYLLIIELTKWLQENSKKAKEDLQKKISEYKILEKAIFHDAIECEHFIQDIKMLELPLRLLSLIK